MRLLNPFHFQNSYRQLPAEFYSASRVKPLHGTHLIHFNQSLAQQLGCLGDATQFFDAIHELLTEPPSEPIAMCYAGHQFGSYVERLGDGRAMLLGQALDAQGQSWDLHLKGGGPTLYSRGGDGRAVLRSSIREYLCSEAMHGLGIPTTRALCLLGSEERVRREEIEPAAMIIRVAQSHVRFGSFEYFYHNNLHDHVRQLADYVIEHHFPALRGAENPYHGLLLENARCLASLIAQWQGVGFCHGVMNSDNMSILGLTLDYGPFGFVDTFESGYICNHSDHYGRYAYDQQPDIGLFNLSCLAQAIFPLLSEDRDQGIALARSSFDVYQETFSQQYGEVVRKKLGLCELKETDRALWSRLLAIMEKQVDFTVFFRKLSSFDTAQDALNAPLRDMFIDRAAFNVWAGEYRLRLLQEGRLLGERQRAMNAVNPKYILRNYLAEQAIRKAQDEGDYTEIETLACLLQNPYDEQQVMSHYADAPPEWGVGMQLSCSS